MHDWEGDRRESVPGGFQLGKVMYLWSQPARIAIHPQYTCIQDDGLAEWQVGLSFTILAPGS